MTATTRVLFRCDRCRTTAGIDAATFAEADRKITAAGWAPRGDGKHDCPQCVRRP